jgi:hypothetical protein
MGFEGIYGVLEKTPEQVAEGLTLDDIQPDVDLDVDCTAVVGDDSAESDTGEKQGCCATTSCTAAHKAFTDFSGVDYLLQGQMGQRLHLFAHQHRGELRDMGGHAVIRVSTMQIMNNEESFLAAAT